MVGERMILTNWVDINELQPKDKQECIIFTKKGKMFRATWREHKTGNPECKTKGHWHYNNRYYDDNTTTHWMPLPPTPAAEIANNDFFGAVINCAIRYACGRQTYMPSLIIEEVQPWLPLLNAKTLACMERDIREADKFGGYGDEKIDKPEWLKFLKEIQDLMDKRGIERWR